MTAGFSRCTAIPGLITCHKPVEWTDSRDDAIAFVGHTWRYHFYRHTLLGQMRRAGLPLQTVRGTRDDSARAYSQSLISFNCSLNSDINVRNFEVLSSRGFLLTEALPEVTGFGRLFRPGEGCETYAGPEELLSKIAFYRANPEAAETLRQMLQEREQAGRPERHQGPPLLPGPAPAGRPGEYPPRTARAPGAPPPAHVA